MDLHSETRFFAVGVAECVALGERGQLCQIEDSDVEAVALELPVVPDATQAPRPLEEQTVAVEVVNPLIAGLSYALAVVHTEMLNDDLQALGLEREDAKKGCGCR